jgi:hypothetical protein
MDEEIRELFRLAGTRKLGASSAKEGRDLSKAAVDDIDCRTPVADGCITSAYAREVLRVLCVASLSDAFSGGGGAASNFHVFTHSAYASADVGVGRMPMMTAHTASRLTNLRIKLFGANTLRDCFPRTHAYEAMRGISFQTCLLLGIV